MFTKYDEICPFQRLHKTCTISSPKYVVFLPSAFFIVHLVVSSALFLSPKDEAISSGHIVLFLLYLGLCSSKFFWSVNLSSRDKVICANSRYIDVLFPHPTVEYSLFALNTTFSDARQHLANNQVATPPSAITNLPSLTTNASFSTEPFSYIIPYNESQECDIFGPLCQTGLVTVGVSLASSTTTTTIPCSSYLSAQAAYLLSARLESGGYITLQEPREWLTAFGRSPECKSYAGVHRNGEQYTFSDCGSKNTIIQASEGFSLPTQIPPGVVDRFRPLDYACCGNCTLIVPEVRLLYFPDQAAPQCENPSSNSSAIVSARPNNKRVQPLNNTGTTAIFSGHTLYVTFSDVMCL